MKFHRAFYLLPFLLLSVTSQAQINIYVGGNLQGNYTWIRGNDHTFNLGFGGGLSFVYWEYEYWFLKAGLDYSFKTSSSTDFPEDYGVPIIAPEDKVNITFSEQTLGIPLIIYFRPFESGSNTLLITGSLKTLFVTHLQENSEEYGELILDGNDIQNRIKSNVGIGIGYQRQLDQHTYLNIVPSFDVDIRSARAYNSITLTAELIFGIY